jgi:predicted ester cyclase
MRDTKTTYLEMLEAINARNVEAAAKFMAPNCKNFTPLPGEPEGVEGLHYRMNALKSAMEDFHFNVIHSVVDGKFIASRGTVTGTHTGTFMGLAPTHKKIKLDWSDHLRIENGLMQDHWALMDMASLFMQLGLMK